MTDAGQKSAVGIDVGGTNVRFARVTEGRVVGEVWRGVTVPWHTPKDFLEFMRQGIASVHGATSIAPPTRQIDAQLIGLALPGLVDPQRGCLLRSVNLSFLENIPLRTELAKLTGSAVHLMTDAAAATWGEYQAQTSPPSTFAHLRLGTGIALGIVRDGALVDLDTGRTRHLEILVVEQGAEAVECRCGLRGCLETIASGRALAEQWSGDVGGFRAAYLNGEHAKRDLVERARRGMGQALRNIARQFGITHVSLGGGVVQRFPELAELVIADARAQGTMVVEGARLGDDAGVIGAARLALAHAK